MSGNNCIQASKSQDSQTLEVDGAQQLVDTYGREFQVPDFTMKEIFEAIPARCFERSTVKSLSYVARDLCLIVALGSAAYFLIPMLPNNMFIRACAWALYSFCQGLVATGIWILAHECGHQAFSPSGKINDTVGWILHSALLVPFFSWKYSHGKHHKATGNLGKDMVFVPKTRSVHCEVRHKDSHDYRVSDETTNSKFYDLVEETPLATFINCFNQQLFGWPMYLCRNATGQRLKQFPRWKVNHFVPTSPLFTPSQYWNIVLSDVGLLIASGILYWVGSQVGSLNLTLYYFIPYLWVNNWLVLITFLQHTDPALPHYRDEAWNFERGASATIDRDFGFIGRHILHGIIETHVAHHLCSRIPFYNADEATVAAKKVMGNAYQRDDTNIFLAAWRSARMCQWIEDHGSVVFFKNANGLGWQG